VSLARYLFNGSFTTKIIINELRESSKVIGWKCLLVGKQHAMLALRGECKCENLTSESQGDITGV